MIWNSSLRVKRIFLWIRRLQRLLVFIRIWLVLLSSQGRHYNRKESTSWGARWRSTKSECVRSNFWKSYLDLSLSTELTIFTKWIKLIWWISLIFVNRSQPRLRINWIKIKTTTYNFTMTPQSLVQLQCQR